VAPDAGATEEEGDEDAEEEEAEEPDAPTAPYLKGRGSPAFYVRLVRDAAAPDLFGAHNEMEIYLDVLAPDDLRAMAEWLTYLRTASKSDIDHLDDL
jgi:hypothetical protein